MYVVSAYVLMYVNICSRRELIDVPQMSSLDIMLIYVNVCSGIKLIDVPHMSSLDIMLNIC